MNPGIPRSTVTAIAVIAVLCCVLFSASTVGGRVLGGENNLLLQVPFQAPPGLAAVNGETYDALYVFHPDLEAARDALRSLSLPDWSPYLGGGEPLLASQQHAALYPINLLAAVLPFWHSLGWIAALKLLLAGVGTLLFLRSLGLRTTPALFGALAFAFGTFMVTWIEHPHVNSYALIPWALLTTGRLARDGTVRAALMCALVFGASCLGGQPESSFLLLLVTLPWFALRCSGRGATGRRAGLMAGSVLLGAGVGAVVLIPFAELAAHSYELGRGGGSGGPKSMGLSFYMPDLWGRPDKLVIGGQPGDLPYPERTAYFGALPLMLAIGGLAARRPRPEQVFFVVAGLLALGLAIHVPVYTSFVSDLPLFREANLTRALVISAFAGSVLAAFGLQALLDGDERARRRVLIGAAVAALPPFLWLGDHAYLLHRLGGALDQLPVQEAGARFIRDIQMAVVLRWGILALAGLAALVVASRRPRLAGRVAVAMVAVTALDLITLMHGYQPTAAASVANPPVPAAITHLDATLGHGRVVGGAEFGPNIAERYAVRDARVHEQPIIARRERLWLALGGDGAPQRPEWDVGDDRLADLFAVKYAFSVPLAQSPTAGWEQAPGPFMVERTKARPRAWVAQGWRSAGSLDGALADVTAAPASDDMTRPVIEGAPGDAAAAAPAAAHFVKDGTRKVVLSANAPRAGYLVLADTFYPGWHATVDGKDTPIHAANVAFRAVAVPAGNHTVAFEYRPLSVRVGAALTLLSLLVLGGGLVATRRRRPSPDG